MRTIGFVGAGNMARALALGLVKSPERFALCGSDPDAPTLARFARESGARALADNREVARESDVIVLAVKPQVMSLVLDGLARAVEPRHLVISIAAGVTLGGMMAKLGTATRLIRVMPNTPALVGEGMSVLVAGGGATREDVRTGIELFEVVGAAVEIHDEDQLNAVTAVSGSGPGFVFAFAEALVSAAERAGLQPELALQLVKQTLLGSSVLWHRSSESAANLRAMVSSPGGTTLAGLEALKTGGFAAAIDAAITAAARRSRELSGS